MCSGPSRSASATAPKKGKKKRAGSESQFPGKLHDMMEFISREGLEDVVTWVNGGTGFVVVDSDKLVELLPRFFSQTKYRSFQRQLNMWHFQRILDGPHRGGWKHPYFLQNKRSLCRYMSRDLMKIPSKAFVMKQQMQLEMQQLAQQQMASQPFMQQQQQQQPRPQTQMSGCGTDASCNSGFVMPTAPVSVSALPYKTMFQSRQTHELLDAAALISQAPFEPTPIEQMKPASLAHLGHLLQDTEIMSFGGRNFHCVDDNNNNNNSNTTNIGNSSDNTTSHQAQSQSQRAQHSCSGSPSTHLNQPDVPTEFSVANLLFSGNMTDFTALDFDFDDDNNDNDTATNICSSSATTAFRANPSSRGPLDASISTHTRAVGPRPASVVSDNIGSSSNTNSEPTMLGSDVTVSSAQQMAMHGAANKAQSDQLTHYIQSLGGTDDFAFT